jgi:hypothetical protein
MFPRRRRDMPDDKGPQKSEARDLKAKPTIDNDEPTVTPTPINPPPK